MPTNTVSPRKIIYGRVPKAYRNYLSRYAVLFPLTSPPTPYPADKARTAKYAYIAKQIKSKTEILVGQWERRVSELRRVGWNAVEKDSAYYFASICCPDFITVDQMRNCPIRVCKRDHVCPFCYSRTVGKVYDSIRRAAKGSLKPVAPEDTSDYQIVGLIQRISLRGVLTSRKLTNEVKWRRDLYGRLGAYGGYLSSSIEPLGPEEWKVTRRSVLLVDNTEAKMQQIYRLNNLKQSLRLDTYAPYKLVNVVGKTLRYPVRLMRTKRISRVAILLNTRQGYRLSASYGFFRKLLK